MSESQKKESPKNTELMSIMLQELTWRALKDMLATKKNCLIAFQRGGFSLDIKNRSRAEELLTKKLDEEDGKKIFMLWYREKKDYRAVLDEYIMANASEDSSEEDRLKGAVSHIREESYISLLKILANEHAGLFLSFCPELFSDKQTEGIRAILKAQSSVRKRHSRETLEAAGVTEYIRDLKNQLQKAKSQEKKLIKSENICKETTERIRKEVAKMVAKNTQQADLLQKYRLEMDDRIEEAQRGVLEKLISCKEALFKAQMNIDDLKKKLERALQQVDLKIKENWQVRAQLDEVKNRNNLRFIKILERIDKQGIILALNEPDDVREKLHTLVRPQQTDDIGDQKDCYELRNRWESMIKSESSIIDRICRMDITEVNDVYYQNWIDHTDDFNGLIYSLRARAVLVKMIHEILWQNRE